MRDPQTASSNKVATFYQKTLALQEKRKLRRGRKDLKESPAPTLQHGQCRGHNI